MSEIFSDKEKGGIIMDRTKKAWINGLFLIITLFINTLGALGIVNGLSQKEVSDMYLTLITPAPSAFRIWSVIYSLLILSIIVMIIKKDDSYYKNAIDNITAPFRISCIFNIAWIVAFSYVQIELSALLILGFLISLLFICIKLKEIQLGKRFLLPLTFGFYTGWLFIATVVNISALLVKLKLDSFVLTNETWAIVMLVVAVILVFVALSKIRNAVFPLPVAWAYWGIYQFLKASEGFKGEFALLENVALVGIIFLVVMAAIQLYQNKFNLLPNKYDNNRMV